jgi:hypothetical protein
VAAEKRVKVRLKKSGKLKVEKRKAKSGKKES